MFQGLRTPASVDPGRAPAPAAGTTDRSSAERLQRVRQRLAPLGEHGPDHPHEAGHVGNVHGRAAETSAGRRPNAPGAPAETPRAAATARGVTSALHRGQHRQHAVVAGADLGDQPVGDLLLQHQDGVAHAAGRWRPARAARTGWARRCCRGGCRPRERSGRARAARRASPTAPRPGRPRARRRRPPSRWRAWSPRARPRGRGPLRPPASRPHCSASGRVIAARPGPISRMLSSGLGVDGLDDLGHPRRLEKVLRRTACAPSRLRLPLIVCRRRPGRPRRAASAPRAARSRPRPCRSSGPARGSGSRRSRRRSRPRRLRNRLRSVPGTA